MIVSTTTTQALQEALRNKAGVSPSQHWLNDCLEYLQAATTTNNNIHNNIDPSIVLEQILHHDLRDVVRELLSDDASPELCAATTSTHQPLHPSLLLRQALHNSTQSSHQYQATLPSHFRLLVQMEEVLDVSQNAEARYSLGPTSFHDVAPIGNQQHRVLKFALSDGYNNHENSGIRNSNHDTQSSLFVGMEYRGSGAAILSSLSAHSRAGIKMILQGPLKCRHGILLLNEANTHVLGGYVPHLLEMQQQALQQARTLAGVGVDPTIKALIGNNPTAVDEEQDEGEMASGDVQASPPPPPAQPLRQTLPPLAAPNNGTTLTPVMTTTTTATPFMGNPSTVTAPPQVVSTASRLNPYSNATPSSNRQLSSSSVSSSSRIASPRRINPYASTVTTTSTFSSAGTTSRVMASPALGIDTHIASTVGPTLSFADLRNELSKALVNRECYERLSQRTHRVTLQQNGLKLYFNIEKRKNRQANEPKHQFVMNARFQGPLSQKDGLITCRLESEILDPFFEKPATEIRKLNKENRPLVERLISDGGNRVQEALYQQNLFEVRLYRSTDEFFADDTDALRTVDGDKPILMLLRRVSS